MGWLTLGTTASSSSSGTCTTLTAMVHWTRTTSNAWPFATPSLKARASGMRPLSRRTKRSWLTCGTRSLSWLILTRITKSQPKSSKRESRFLVKEKASQICQMLSDFSLTLNSEPLTLTVTVPLALPHGPCDDILLSPFFHSLLLHYHHQYYSRPRHEFLSSFHCQHQERNGAVSRRANSFGISTLLAFHFTTDLKKARRVSLKTANSK